MRVPILNSNQVTLRPLRLSDAPQFCRWFDNPEVTRFLKRYQDPPTLREERTYIRAQRRKPNQAQWVILANDGTMIGTVGLSKINYQHQRAEYGIFIGDPKYWGQGYGTNAGRLAVRYGFQRLHLHRIRLHVYAYNIRGAKSYRKIGFHREGRLRDHLYRDGHFHDVIVMGILRSEFRKLKFKYQNAK